MQHHMSYNKDAVIENPLHFILLIKLLIMPPHHHHHHIFFIFSLQTSALYLPWGVRVTAEVC